MLLATSKSISASAIVTDSSIGEKVKIYRNAEIKDSILGSHVSVGDQTVILKSDIKSNVALNRRNYILRTIIGSYTYTGIGTMTLSANIGRFCSIAWNVSIGGADHDYKNVTTSPLSVFVKLVVAIPNKLVSNYVRNFHRVSKWFKPPGGSPEFVQG